MPNVKSAKRKCSHENKDKQKTIFPDLQAQSLSWQNKETSGFLNRVADSMSKEVMPGTKQKRQGQKNNQNKDGANDKDQKPDDKYTALKRVSTG